MFIAYLEEYTKRRKDDGKNDLADIAVESSVSGSGLAVYAAFDNDI